MGMKPSRKYVIGSWHENGGGKFEILDRYWDEKESQPMLSYRYEGCKDIQTNKEANINASIYKFQKVRGITKTAIEKHEMEDAFAKEVGIVTGKIDKLIDSIGKGMVEVQDMLETISNMREEIMTLHKMHLDQGKMIKEILDEITTQQKQIDHLMNNHAIIDKLVSKI